MTMKQKVIFPAIILLVGCQIFISCNDGYRQVKFEKIKWSEQLDPLFPSGYRLKMLEDLTKNYKLKGLKYSELIELLGIPDAKDSISLSYKIVVDYQKEIDPVYTKDLEFAFSKDSIITSFKINEWKK